jgi:hypothetical protein
MSALGHKQTFNDVPPMSALPLKADVRQRSDFISFQISIIFRQLAPAAPSA